MDILTSNVSGILPMILRFLINIIATGIITHCLYFPKSRHREYYFTFMLIGVSVFFLINLLGGTQVKIEFALGLFAIFGIIRYRTESMPVREMTYLFTILALSVINGLSATLGYVYLAVVNVLFIALIYIFENIKLKGSLAVKMVQYDRIELIKPECRQQLIEDLRERTGLDIEKVEIGGIDFLRDMSVIKIFYRSEESNSVDGQVKLHQEEYV